MANPDRPNGFIPVGTLDGSPWNGKVRRYAAADRSSDSTNNHGDIYVGDPVSLSSGAIVPADSGDTVVGVAVAVGVEDSVNDGIGPFDPNNLEKRYLALGEDGYVYVAPADGVLFEVQTAADLDLVPGSAADFSTDADEAHGSRVTGRSSAELVANSNGDVVVVEDNLAVDNDTSLANARHVVRFTTTAFTQ